MKNKRKIFVILIFILFTLVITLNIPVYGANDDINTWRFSIKEDLPVSLLNIAGYLIALLRNAVIIGTVLVIIFLGIKYMISSVEERAVHKQAYVNIVIGVVFISLVTNIISMVFSIAGI